MIFFIYATNDCYLYRLGNIVIYLPLDKYFDIKFLYVNYYCVVFFIEIGWLNVF